MDTVYIAAGSNKGDRAGNIIQALRHIQKVITITEISSFIETLPAEGVEGGPFINGVIEGKTSLAPVKLFEFLQDIEKIIGREHPHKKGDEREIDLDIIFYSSMIIKTKKLVVPHSRYRRRAFVLGPLCEISPDFIDPETRQTVYDIYREMKK